MSNPSQSIRPLTHILDSNSKSFHADLTQFAQLDESLSHIPVHLGNEEFEVDFTGGNVQNNSLVFEGQLVFPNKTKERLPLIKATTSGDDVAIEFLQDVDLDGKSKIYTYTPSPQERKEYNSFRNGLFSHVHELITKEYSGRKSAALIRKRFKQI